MDAADVDAEIGVRQVAVAEPGRVREEDVDQQAADGEGDGESEVPEAGVDVVRRDDVVVVAVPEEDVALERGRGGGIGCRFDGVAMAIELFTWYFLAWPNQAVCTVLTRGSVNEVMLKVIGVFASSAAD